MPTSRGSAFVLPRNGRSPAVRYVLPTPSKVPLKNWPGEQVPDEAALLAVERNVIEEVDAERLRAINLRQPALAPARAERVLRVRRGDVEAARARAAEYLAGVVNRLAPRVGRAERQRVVEEAPVVARLHRVVDGLRGVGADGQAALRQQATVARALVRERRRVVNAVLRGQPRGQELREARQVDARPAVVRDAVQQRADEEVAVEILEEADAVRADVAHLGDVVLAELVLHAERPLLRVGRAEVRRDLALRQETRVELAERQDARRCRRRPDGVARQRGRERERRVRRGQLVRRQRQGRREGRAVLDVRQDVVERRLVGYREPAADYRRVLAQESFPEVRRVGEADARREVVLVSRNRGHRLDAERERREVERRRRVALALGRHPVQDVDGLAGVLVAHAEVQRQVGPELKVVLHEVILVVLGERQLRVASRDGDGRRRVVDESRRVAEGELAVEVRQERNLLGDVLVLRAEDEVVPAARPAQVVGQLRDAADAALREDVPRPDCLQRVAADGGEDDVGDRRADLKRAGDAARVNRAATAELHPDILAEGAELADHRVGDRARPDAAVVPAVRRDVAGEAVGLRQRVDEGLVLLLVAHRDVVLV